MISLRLLRSLYLRWNIQNSSLWWDFVNLLKLEKSEGVILSVVIVMKGKGISQYTVVWNSIFNRVGVESLIEYIYSINNVGQIARAGEGINDRSTIQSVMIGQTKPFSQQPDTSLESELVGVSSAPCQLLPWSAVQDSPSRVSSLLALQVHSIRHNFGANGLDI